MIKTPPKITLEAARVNAGLTLKEASVKLGISIPTLSRWEKDSTNVTISHLKKIEEAYGYPIDYIFFGNSLELKSS